MNHKHKATSIVRNQPCVDRLLLRELPPMADIEADDRLVIDWAAILDRDEAPFCDGVAARRAPPRPDRLAVLEESRGLSARKQNTCVTSWCHRRRPRDHRASALRHCRVSVEECGGSKKPMRKVRGLWRQYLGT